MFKPLQLILLSLLISTISISANSQGNSFSNSATTNNKRWVVSKYFITGSNQELKSVFNNLSFQFIISDTTSIIVRDVVNNNRPPYKGFWAEQADNKVKFFLPLDPVNRGYDHAALLLNRAAMTKAEISSSKMSFKVADLMNGEIQVEFTVK